MSQPELPVKIRVMDLLSDVLAVAGVRGAVGARIEAGQDWGWWWPSATPRAALHAVTSGTAWLGRPGQAPAPVMPGAGVVLPGGTEHALGSDPAAITRTGPDAADRWYAEDDGVVRIGRGPGVPGILGAGSGAA